MHWLDWLGPEPTGEGLVQLGRLLLALALCSLIGLERELKMKSAGLRTQALVGVGAALFMLVSKYGFSDVLGQGLVVLDPSRVAAQIVSGIGFIGGGLIFVHRDVVRGLTTAAIVWLSAAVGMACAAGLPLLAIAVTLMHFLVVYGYTPLVRRILAAHVDVIVHYRPGHGVVKEVVQLCTGSGFSVQDMRVARSDPEDDTAERVIQLHLHGHRSGEALLAALGDVAGVATVRMSPGEHR